MVVPAIRMRAILSVALIAIVVTQIIYFTLSSAGADINRPLIWGVEASLFLLITMLGFTLMVQERDQSTIWAAVAASGLINVIQVGMGLVMFPPLQDGGEALAPVFTAVLAQAFFLYFAGKVLFGVAALMMGVGLFRFGRGAWRIMGPVTAIAGLAATLINAIAMPVGLELVMPAGAAGTIATLLLALALGHRQDDRQATAL